MNGPLFKSFTLINNGRGKGEEESPVRKDTFLAETGDTKYNYRENKPKKRRKSHSEFDRNLIYTTT